MLIRCEYCGMAYDGDSNENCPHCLAPRPDVTHDDGESIVFYADGEEFCEVGADDTVRVFCLDGDEVVEIGPDEEPPSVVRERERQWVEDRVLTTLMQKSGLRGTSSNDVYPPRPCFRCRVHAKDDGGMRVTATLFCGFLDRRSRRAFEAALDEVGTWHGTPERGYWIDDLRFERMSQPGFAITVNDEIWERDALRTSGDSRRQQDAGRDHGTVQGVV